MEVVSGDNWSYKSCKALVKSSSPTNQHPVFYRPDVLPVTQPTVSALKGKVSHFVNVLSLNSTEALPSLSLTTKGSWIPWWSKSKLENPQVGFGF